MGASGFGLIPVRMDADGALPDEVAAAIESGARAVILTPRAHNPTGAAFSTSRATALRRVLRSSSDVLLIENDPAGPVAGVPYVTVTAELKRWAVVRSVSKFLGPDLRTAIVCGDARTIARVHGRQSLGCRWVSHLLQQMTLALWSDPSSGRRLAHAADVYAARRRALVTALAAHRVTIDCRSGFNVWIPVREETAVVQRLAQHGWAVAAGERFRIRSGPAVRVTASALAVDQAPRLAADIAAALDRSGASAV
jgi:DNA-binding transcriptional MocR family regulator